MSNKSSLLIAIISLGAALLAVSSVGNSTSNPHFTENQKELLQQFENWSREHGKVYSSPEEKLYRFKLFVATSAKLMSIRSDKSLTYEVAHNQFSDMTVEEVFPASTQISPENPKRKTSKPISKARGVGTPGELVDWEAKGVVSPVKTQDKSCPVSYAISPVETTEGIYAIYKLKLTPFSVQQVIDCSTKTGNRGCYGGKESNSFHYMSLYEIEAEADYPFVGTKGSCNYDESKGVIRVTEFTVETTNCQGLLGYLDAHPVTVQVAATALIHYKGGIYNNQHCGLNLNSYMTATGYDTRQDTQDGMYFRLKNSWGPNWGEKGYIRMILDHSDKGMCGMCSVISFPLLRP